jgi:hypothetical protein
VHVVRVMEGRVNRCYKATELDATITIVSVCELVRSLACGYEYQRGILL